MGQLVNGKWINNSIVTSRKDGDYDRLKRTFLDTISSDHDQFKPESNRYHLYVSLACPWAHRTLIYRKLKGLTDHIAVSIVHPDMLDNGWEFRTDFDQSTGDQLYNLNYLYELYQKASDDLTTSVTVPVLWDTKTCTIVNNESSQIIRIFNSAFNELTGNTNDYYPTNHQTGIDALNEFIYESVNNGVYRCGFATTQLAYDRAIDALFSTLDELDNRLSNSDFLMGDQLTEADIRLIPTLLRFDIVYVTHFKCNVRRIIDSNLHRYVNQAMTIPAIQTTTVFDHIKRHYYYSHDSLLPIALFQKARLIIK